MKNWTTRFIDLDKCRSPDLVGEISDTTLAIDLDAKKRMYAELGISEYWIIDMRASGIFALRLDEGDAYQECEVSQVSPNLAIALLKETLEQLTTKTNPEAAILIMTFDLPKPSNFERRHRLFKDRYCGYSQ